MPLVKVTEPAKKQGKKIVGKRDREMGRKYREKGVGK